MIVSLLFLLQAGAEPPVAVRPPKPKLICREQEQLLGTHIRSGRRCRTAEQWETEDAARNQPVPSMTITPGQGDGIPRTTRPQP